MFGILNGYPVKHREQCGEGHENSYLQKYPEGNKKIGIMASWKQDFTPPHSSNKSLNQTI